MKIRTKETVLRDISLVLDTLNNGHELASQYQFTKAAEALLRIKGHLDTIQGDCDECGGICGLSGVHENLVRVDKEGYKLMCRDCELMFNLEGY
jgi:hypothetical protein